MKIRNYLEIIEQLTEEEMLEKQPQIIRIEVKNKTEAKTKSKQYESVFKGLKYKKQFHIHKHSKGGNIACEIEKL